MQLYGIVTKNKVSKLEDHLGYWLRCVSNFVSDSFAEKLAGEDVSVAQWVVLRTLYDYECLTLNEAADLVGVDKSSLSRMVERLVLRRLVSRTEGEDRRSVRLALTTATRKLVPRLAALADENDQRFFEMLSVQERKELLRLVRKILGAHGWDGLGRGGDRMK